MVSSIHEGGAPLVNPTEKGAINVARLGTVTLRHSRRKPNLMSSVEKSWQASANGGINEHRLISDDLAKLWCEWCAQYCRIEHIQKTP